MTGVHAQPSVRSATAADRTTIERLLVESALPTAGVADWLDRFLVAEHDGELVGVAGLEMYGDGALLRSVAVASAWRGSGIARRLVDDLLERARGQGVRDIFLLTTTAERYFPRLGFTAIERGEVPSSVQASVEFKGLCPASAVAMRKSIG